MALPRNTSEVGTYVSPFHSIPKGEKVLSEHAQDWPGKEDRVMATVELCCLRCIEQFSRHAPAWGCDLSRTHSHHHTEHGLAQPALNVLSARLAFLVASLKRLVRIAAGRKGLRRHSGTLSPWLAGRGENCCSTPFLLFSQSGTLAHAVVRPTFRVGLPTPVKAVKLPNRHAQKLFPR